MKPRIVFIHGMFLTPHSWAPWIGHFENLGYECSAPAWPFHTGEPDQLRANPPPRLGQLDFATLLDHHRELLAVEPAPPILIGHSLGGLIVQKLVAEGYGRAAVTLCSVAPNHMLAFDWGFLRNTVTIANPLAGESPVGMTPALFHRSFANTVSEEQSDILWNKYAVHESRVVFRDVMGDAGRIDVERPHVPLLFIGAEEDQIIPAALTKRNAQAWSDPRSHSEGIQFTGRGHFIQCEPRWEEVAEGTSNWLAAHLTAVRA